MTVPKPPKVRLAVAGTPAPEVFNFYQIVSLLSGLYIKVNEREDVATYKAVWSSASDSLLGQIGDIYNLWHAAQKSAAEGIPLPDDQRLVDRASRFAHRLVAIEERLSIWEPASRWARVICMIETKLDRLAGQIAEHNPYVAEEIKTLMTEGFKRRSSVVMIQDQATGEEIDINSNFAIPVAL
jgi:hypothetical protein